MKPIVPSQKSDGGTLVMIAAHQPTYAMLPAYVDKEGLVMTEWEFTGAEVQTILEGGKLRMWTITNNEPFQPVILEVARQYRIV